MLSTTKSASVGFRPVVQLFAPPTNPATHLAEKILFYKCAKTFLWVSTMCSQILGFSRVSATL